MVGKGPALIEAIGCRVLACDAASYRHGQGKFERAYQVFAALFVPVRSRVVAHSIQPRSLFAAPLAGRPPLFHRMKLPCSTVCAIPRRSFSGKVSAAAVGQSRSGCVIDRYHHVRHLPQTAG